MWIAKAVNNEDRVKDINFGLYIGMHYLLRSKFFVVLAFQIGRFLAVDEKLSIFGLASFIFKLKSDLTFSSVLTSFGDQFN